MSKHKGFTLIEVSIFLAITGLLIGAILVGTNNSIEQQRFTDSVQSFADFLRGVYSTVENPQNVTSNEGGRSESALYGQLITFGESVDFDGRNAGEKQLVLVYDVVGDATGKLDGGDILDTLEKRNVNVVTKTSSGFVVNGAQESYAPKWGNRIQSTGRDVNGKGTNFKGALLVVRSPMSGAIHTFAKIDGTIEVNQQISPTEGPPDNFNPLSTALDSFRKQGVDFCIGGDGLRQNVRLNANAHNSSDIVIVPLDDSENECKSEG